MKSGPFIDRDHANQIIREAKALRRRELGDAARWALATIRKGGVFALIASGLAITGTHALQNSPPPTGGDGSALSN